MTGPGDRAATARIGRRGERGKDGRPSRAASSPHAASRREALALRRAGPATPAPGCPAAKRLALAAAGFLLVATPHLADAAAGDPLPGLSPAHLQWFADGKVAFDREYTPETGLGPTFNGVSCVECHSDPAAGGGSAIPVKRFGRASGDTYDTLLAEGGPLLQSKAIDPACAEEIPADANVVAERLTTPLFGGGLVEAIPDASILARADPDDADRDGISGRAHMVHYPGAVRVGRFGWKAHEATLLSFTADAMASEMGVTNALEPSAPPPNGDTALAAACEAMEGTADPEDVTPVDGFSELVKITNFSRLLAPPTDAGRPSGRGWKTFRRVRCERCHTARWTTGRHTIPALAYVTFYPYSDFLLHDMGSLGDGIVQGGAGATEMRSAPLWGIAQRTKLLHDGRATTIEEAILAHDGEAADSRDRYLRLGPDARQRLLVFVAGR